MALALPIVLGPYEHEAVDAMVGLIIVTPASILGALGLVPAWAVWRARPWGRTVGVAWAAVIAAFYAVGLAQLWVPLAGGLGDPDRWSDVAQPQYFLPLPFVVGGVGVLLLLVRPPRWVAILAVLALVVLLVAGGLVGGAALQKPMPTPAPIAPASPSGIVPAG